MFYNQAALEGSVESHALVVGQAAVPLLYRLIGAIPLCNEQTVGRHGLELLLLVVVPVGISNLDICILYIYI